MVILTATCRNGEIELTQALPPELEGKTIQIKIEEIKATPPKCRKAGTAEGQIWISPDFDAPLADFQDYMP